MVEWTDIINKWGFNISFVRADRCYYGGWSVSFSFKRFHIGMGVNPQMREDCELS